MSDAIYCATRNFASAFQVGSKLSYNPTRAVRIAAGAVALAASQDKPEKNLYRNSIPVHLTKMALLGPRWGARAGASAAQKLVQSNKQQTVRFKVIPESDAVLRQSLVGRLTGLGGTFVGGLLGFTLKSGLHLGVASLLVGATLVGATIGCLGIPVAGAYALHVAASSKKRQLLRARRHALNTSAVMAFSEQNATQPSTSVAANKAEFYAAPPWENVVKSPGNLSPVRTGRG